MKNYLRAVIAGSWVLAAGVIHAGEGETFSYTVIMEETLKQSWVVDVAPEVLLKSNDGTFKIRDKVAGKNKTIDKKGSVIGIDEYNIIDFCIEAQKEPICREIIISDFSYEGLSGLLLGGRGKRLKYIVLADCEESERTCRYPHIKLGPNPVLLLQKKGIRPHLLSVEGSESVVAGPYAPDEVEKVLQTIRPILPGAFIR